MVCQTKVFIDFTTIEHKEGDMKVVEEGKNIDKRNLKSERKRP